MDRIYRSRWSSVIPVESRVIEYFPEEAFDYIPVQRRYAESKNIAIKDIQLMRKGFIPMTMQQIIQGQ